MALINKNLLGDKAFFRNIYKLALPIALANLLSSSANLIDTVMVGQLGEVPLSAVGMAGQWSFFMFLFFFGFSSGASVFFSQYWGARDIPRIRHTYTLGLLNVLAISIIFFVVGLCAPTFVMKLFSDDPAVIDQGVLYLKIAVFAYVIQSMNVFGGTLLRSTEEVRLPMIANIIQVFVNTFLNWVLIYGKFGAPQMGVRGAALATVISAWVGTIVLYGVSFIKKNMLCVPIQKFFTIKMSTIKRFYPVALPVVVNESTWALATMVMNMVYGRLGTGNYSAMTVKNTIENLIFTFFIGLANACTVMVGKRIGAGEYKKGYQDAQRFGFLAPMLAIVLVSIIVIFRFQLVNIYNLSEEVKATARTLLCISACIYPLRMFNHMNIVGTFRAGGDTKASMYLDMGSIWLTSVPLTALAGLVLHWPFPFVYAITAFEEIMKFSIGFWYLRSGRWIRPVTGSVGPIDIRSILKSKEE